MGRKFRPSMASLQEEDYGRARDYAFGSPHLTHRRLRESIERDLIKLVRESIDRTGQCRVVELGAGHGSFTTTLAGAGASVTVTEMSQPSIEVLTDRFAENDQVSIVYDPDGNAVREAVRAGCDLLVFISVLHHIPDYLGVVEKLCEDLAPGAALFTVQDPVWYPTAGRRELVIARGSYYAWRLTKGNYVRGVGTQIRRLRGVYDETKNSDMVEYHVVRQGVNQAALVDLLEVYFADVRMWKYWGTQSSVLQRIGERRNWVSSFGTIARNRRP